MTDELIINAMSFELLKDKYICKQLAEKQTYKVF